MCKICITRRLVVDIFPWSNANIVPFPSGTLVARRMGNGRILMTVLCNYLLFYVLQHLGILVWLLMLFGLVAYFRAPRELKTVAIPMLMMLKDVIRALGKLLVVVFFVAILNFQNGRHQDFKMVVIFNIFWTISQLLSYLESSKLWQYPCLWCLGLQLTHLENY